MRLTRNNNGTSLIELVIAMAIAAVVLSMIMFFVNGSLRSFRHTNDEVNLQMEAQTTINQLSNLAMKSKEMEVFPSAPAGERRYIFSISNSEYYTIIFNISERRLYQVESSDLEQARITGYQKDLHFLSEYIENLTMTLSTNRKSVSIDLKLSIGREEYQISKKVRMRNAK